MTVACVNIESRKKNRQKIETLIVLTLILKKPQKKKKSKSALKFVFNTNLGEILWVRFEMV